MNAYGFHIVVVVVGRPVNGKVRLDRSPERLVDVAWTAIQ
jgi:hypothetical protein